MTERSERAESAFHVRLVDSSDAALVVLSGELDLTAAPEVERVLATIPEGRRLVIDLRALTFMDSSGVGLLVSAARRTEPSGTRLACIAGPAQIQRILELTGTDRLIDWVNPGPG